jgi:hypothetical protein
VAKRLLMVGLAFLFVGSLGAVAYRVAKKGCGSSKRAAVWKKACAVECAPAKVQNEKKIDVQFESKNLLDVLNFLAEQGLNLVYSEPSLLKDVVVTAKLKQVTVTEAASAILKTLNVKFELTPEKILIVAGR